MSKGIVTEDLFSSFFRNVFLFPKTIWSFIHRLHKKINSVQSVREGLYVAVLFHEVGCVFETVLGWRKGARTFPLRRFGGGGKRRGLGGRRVPAASYWLVILHLWNNTEGKQAKRKHVHTLNSVLILTSEYEGFSNVVLGFNFRLNKLHFDSCKQTQTVRWHHTNKNTYIVLWTVFLFYDSCKSLNKWFIA